MTSHELANYLLTLPDYPVMMNGWGSDEGITVEVVSAEILKREHYAENHEVVLKDEIHLIHETIDWK